MSSALTLSNAVHGTPLVPDSKKRIDFITKLPLEIVVCYILPKILGDFCNLPKVSPCCSVCRAWNEMIGQRLGNIPFYMQCIDDSWSMKDWMQVDAVAPYIKMLDVAESTPFAFWLLGERLRFPSLMDLTLTVTRSRLLMPEEVNQRRYDARSQVPPEPLDLHHLLHHCPTLVELKIATKEFIFIVTGLHYPATYPSIRHLELYYASPTGENPRGPISTKYHVSPALFNHFPRLHLLALWYPQPRYRDMKTIFRYCPMLQQLFLGGISNHLFPEDSKTSQEGLRLLSLQGPSSQGTLIARLLQDHSATVESLVMECAGPWTSPAGLMINDHVSFNQLRSLHLHVRMSRHPMGLVRAVILRSPNIESVNVHRGGLQGELLETLIGRPVRSIDLVCTPWSNPASAFHFLDHHSQLGMNSTLEEITCTITSTYEYRNKPERIYPHATTRNLGGGWMLSIAALQQLKSLDLSLKCDVYKESWATLLRLISQRCPSLEKLTLEFYCFSFNIECILPLARRAKLKKMVIVSKRFPNNISTLVKHFAQVQAFDLKLKTIDCHGSTIDLSPSRIPRKHIIMNPYS